MRLRGKSQEAAGYRAAAANAGLLAARAGAWWATGNDGFIVDAGHDMGDVISLAAKAKAIETESHDTPKRKKLRQRLRIGAAGLFLSGGLFGLYTGADQLANDKSEDAGALALATAVATAAATLEIARRTHAHIDDGDDHHADHSASHDLKLHVWGDAASSAVYATSLGLQAITGASYAGSAGVAASGLITTGLALKTFQEIRKDSDSTPICF